MRTTPRRRTVVYCALVCVVAWALLRQQALVADLRQLVNDERHEDRVEEARECVTAWEVRSEIRESDEEHGRAGGEALIAVTDADEATVAEYRTVLAQLMSEASHVIDDPECDLVAAHSLLADERRRDRQE